MVCFTFFLPFFLCILVTKGARYAFLKGEARAILGGLKFVSGDFGMG